MGLFGPSRAEIWQQLSAGMGATYTNGGFFKEDRVDAWVGDWTVTLDTYTESSEESTTTYTRLRAPFLNATGLRFSISRAGLFTGIGRALGFRDIAVGDPAFDEASEISGKPEGQVVALFQDPQIRQMLAYQPEVHFEIRDNEGWLGPKFPSNTDELCFHANGTITDLNRLRALFDLFAAVLHRLTEIGAAAPGYPGVTL